MCNPTSPQKPKTPKARISTAHDQAESQPSTSRQRGPLRQNTATSRSRRKQMKPVKKGNCRWLKEVRAAQSSTSLLIPLLPFSRLVRKFIQERTKEIHMVQRDALWALHEATAIYLTYFMEDAYRLALLA